MKKKSIILLLLLIAGCGSALKKNWTNFTAYYNTFYNAKKDFHAGRAEVEAQPVILTEAGIIRPHPTPPLAGSNKFNDAIKNASQILRRFPKSKWTDNALLLIGKSYYYLQENFLATQKFDELLALPTQSPLRQNAIIWKGRTLLTINAFAKGASFLERALSDSALKWTKGNKAEAQVVLAEHLALMQQWSKASRILEPAVYNISNMALRGRSYLFLGQLLQKEHHYTRAFQAYSKVKNNYPSYQYIYQADKKRAEVARLAGKQEQAVSIYSDMLNDDKNFKRRNALQYQLAQTYQSEEKYKEAKKIYEKILQNRVVHTANDIFAEVYYQLGKIYSKRYNNYKLAAAYFDSSSQTSSSLANIPRDVDKLSAAYGRYVAIRKNMAQIDSLLVLGSLSDDALKARITKLRESKKNALRNNSQNAVQQTNKSLVNYERNDVYSTISDEGENTDFGFLNYQSKEVVQRDQRKFKAVWGNRPLVDNWRRKEAISGAAIHDLKNSTPRKTATSGRSTTISDKQLGINLSNVPQTAQDRQLLHQQRLKTAYRLGSLFFLTLNQPDSAKFYYQQILKQSESPGLRAQTFYSLFELYTLQEKADSADLYKNRILKSYPHSRYARRIANSGGDILPVKKRASQDSVKILRQNVHQLLARNDSVYSDEKLAEQLIRLAVNHQPSPLASAIYYRGIQKYIYIAKKRDSLATDSLFVKSDSSGRQGYTLYSTLDWDRVRRHLVRFKQLFPRAKQIKQVNTWFTFLNHPDDSRAIKTCKELGAEPVISSGKKRFVNSVLLPAKVKKMNITGSISYQFVITKEGAVQSYKLLSNPTHLGIDKAFQKAIETTLQFEPITQNGHPVRASCIVKFSIRR